MGRSHEPSPTLSYFCLNLKMFLCSQNLKYDVAIVQMFPDAKMGALIKETDDGLSIKGSRLKAAKVDSHKDHRMAMSLTVAAMNTKGTTVIKDIDCIQKTYPSFINDFTNAGAILHEYSN